MPEDIFGLFTRDLLVRFFERGNGRGRFDNINVSGRRRDFIGFHNVRYVLSCPRVAWWKIRGF